MRYFGMTVEYKSLIKNQIKNCLTETQLPFGIKRSGKVRDSYEIEDQIIFITTDRQSAFDRILASIPFKGQVLNQTSAWWFEQTTNIIANHLVEIPDPNATIAKKCQVFPVEFVVRGYITGSTSTALWTHYANGERNYCGNQLPEGLHKNQKLSAPIITPTTKDVVHDRSMSPAEIIAEGLMSAADWEYCSTKALELFRYGQDIAAQHGLILVDTKYEMGKDAEDNVLLIDEIHTPDSSRYWLKQSYLKRFAQGREPENIDKEFLRLWFKDHCDPYHDAVLPPAPEELIIELSRRYILLYEKIIGRKFEFPDPKQPIHDRIKFNLERFFA
jgi:phosphoribosylaminoimidazole-succinocarboxamide synthase